MVNGFPTHNRFTSWDPAFTVLETHGSFPTDAVSIGLQDATITGGEISLPEPTSLALLGLGLTGFGFSRKKKKT